MMSKLRLEGKVAVITGAASGIGEATARVFTEHGARVVIGDVQDELGATVVTSIGADKCSYKHCDVRDEKQVAELVAYAVEVYDRVDVMYSNAGILGQWTSLLDMSLEELDNVVAVNARGAAAAIKHAALAMVAAGTRGSIICTGSMAGTLGGLAPATYTASKHALLGLVRAAAGELGKQGIRVNCLTPSLVATPMGCRSLGMSVVEAEAVLQAASPLKGVVLRARDMGEAALFLASSESAFISGHNLMVDGGFTAVGPVPPLDK